MTEQTFLAQAARNVLVQDLAVTELVGASTKWPEGWIFPEMPFATIENKGKCLIVVSQGNGSWTSPNPHNTMEFPKLIVDVWADPTRNTDNSVRTPDAKDKILAIFHEVNRHFHLPTLGNSDGTMFIWGTPEQQLDGTGIHVLGSTRAGEPDFSPITNVTDAWMGSVTYNVTTIS